MAVTHHFSRLAIACFALSVILFFRADLAFTNGVLVSRTNSPYLNAVSSLVPSERHEPGFWPASAVSEDRLTVGLASLSLLSAIAAMGFAVAARRRHEPSIMYAGVGVLSLGVLGLAARLLVWAWPLLAI